MTRKKVLFVATVVKMHINVFHIPMLKWFHDQGWETHVCAKNDFDEDETCEIPYCDYFHETNFARFPLKMQNIEAYHSMKKLMEKEKFDIVYCHTPVGAAVARLAAASERKKGTKVIYMAHGFHFYRGAPLANWLLYYPAERFLSRFTDLLITINKEDYGRAKSFHMKRLEYIPGVGINLNRFFVSSEIREKKRKELNILDDEFVLVSVGELSKRKNHRVVIEALHQLENRKIKYFICGCGALENELKDLIKEYGLNDQIFLLGFRKDIPEIYNACDVFVFPSLQEGLPVAMMEAMACGLPVIASNIRGNSDLIDRKKGGYLIKPTNVDGFAKGIEKMEKNRNCLDGIRGYNLNKIKQYRTEEIVDKMAELYQQIM